MARGIKPRALGPIDSGNRTVETTSQLGVPFEIRFITTASASTFDWVNRTPHILLVTQNYGYMTGAGATSDTVKVGRVGSSSGDITDTADVSGLSDGDQFDFSEIDDTYNEISPGDTLRVTTVSSALCNVFVRGFWKES